MEVTAGQAIINAMLPKELRDYKRVLDKKAIQKLSTELAIKYPNQYADVVFKLKKIGAKVAYIDGASFDVKDFESPVDKRVLDQEEKSLAKTTITPDKLNEIYKKFSALQQDIEKKTVERGIQQGNSMARQVVSGARGNNSNLASLISSPVMYADHAGRPIPIVIKHSFSEGLDPVEYFGSTYGTRSGVIATKFATPEGGFFNKQVGYVTGNLIITEVDCGTSNGIKTELTDSNNVGRVLATGVASFLRNTVLTTNLIGDLTKKGYTNIMIRSPLTCEADNGVCQKCFGYNEKGDFPPLGENVGINSSAALTEPFTQGAMQEKHSGGVIGQKKRGFELIQQLLKIPKVFPGGAIVTEVAGKVTKIEKAPQGGNFVTVAATRHYLPADREVIVKVGDEVEQGMPLSGGIVNPADVTRLRGVGEGRKFLSDTLRQAFKEDGKDMNKVHMEVLSRAMVNHVQVGDNTEAEDLLPGDVISLARAQKSYRPINAALLATKKAAGMYLAKPYLHYSMGTKLTPKMIDDLVSIGIANVEVSSTESPFSPVMVRLEDVPGYKTNWIERLYSERLKSKIMEATHRGEKANLHGPDFTPAFIHGVEFGKPKVGY